MFWKVLEQALQAPSGGNLQPWLVHVRSGERLDDLKARVRRRVAPADQWDRLPAPPYPTSLPARYAEQFLSAGGKRRVDGQSRLRERGVEVHRARR
ncbi:nitroreductase family protein [Conexibacter sp. S30A1]|uniref:nitroreductase family protein n=1 Tax=Conexibacter sp. S30A1 TaxID=2937800 RepID=UPI0035305DCC